MKLPGPEALLLPPAGAAALLAAAAEALTAGGERRDLGPAWSAFSRARLSLDLPFPAVAALWEVFRAAHDEPRLGPLPAWSPSPGEAAATQVAALARARGFADGPGQVAALQAWSAREREAFWGAALARLELPFATPPERTCSPAHDPRRARWLPGARLNPRRSPRWASPRSRSRRP